MSNIQFEVHLLCIITSLALSIDPSDSPIAEITSVGGIVTKTSIPAGSFLLRRMPREKSSIALGDCDFDAAWGGCKPQFMLVGVEKSGTSSIWKLMKQHSQILSSNTKEPSYFSGGADVGYANARCNMNDSDFHAYLDRFFGDVRKFMHSPEELAGDFSTTYLHCFCCPSTIKRFMPRLKSLVILRDPIERAASRYREQHDKFHLVPMTNGSFDSYVAAKLPALQRCLDGAGERLSEQVRCAGEENVLGLSIYDAPIKNWLQSYDSQQLLVLYLDDLATAPAALMFKIEYFLGIKHIHYDSMDHAYNAAGNWGWDNLAMPDVVMSQATRDQLHAFYRPFMFNLKILADSGRIARLPETWEHSWNL